MIDKAIPQGQHGHLDYSQEEWLRLMPDGWDGGDVLEELQHENATLRTQLADVTVSMGRVEERCARLRELCRRFSDYVSQDRCEGCVYKSRCNDGLIDECWQLTEIRKLASELGVEVDG